MRLHPIGQKLLTMLPLILATVCLPPLAVRAESTPTKAPLSYQETVKSLYQSLEQDREQVSPERYQVFSDLYHALFDASVIQINFHGVFERGAQTTATPTSTLYFSKGEIFIIPAPHNAQLDQSQGERRFFATLNGNVYTWVEGRKEGEILKRVSNDTLNFLFYSIDPSGIGRALYDEHLKAPQNSIISEKGGVKRFMFKKPISGSFAGVLVREKPFWITGFAIATEKSTGGTAIFEVDPPIPLETIPEAVRQLPKDVQFSPSPQTLQNWMVYL